MLKSKLIMNYFIFVLLRPRRNDRAQFQSKKGCFLDYHAILKQMPLEQALSVDPTRSIEYCAFSTYSNAYYSMKKEK